MEPECNSDPLYTWLQKTQCLSSGTVVHISEVVQHVESRDKAKVANARLLGATRLSASADYREVVE